VRRLGGSRVRLREAERHAPGVVPYAGRIHRCISAAHRARRTRPLDGFANVPWGVRGAPSRARHGALELGDLTMRLTRRALVVLLLSAVVPTLGACRHGGNEIDPEEWPRMGPIPLHVRNDNFLDMNVAVQSHGVARRLGSVSGNSNATFRIERNMV